MIGLLAELDDRAYFRYRVFRPGCTVVGILQWTALTGQQLIMRGQLGEMQGGSKQTDRIIAADERIASRGEQRERVSSPMQA